MKTQAKIKINWLDEVKAVEPDVIEMRRYLHQHPELSFAEYKTADYIYKQLCSFGVEDIQRNVGNGLGIVARIHGAKPGPVIALRADFDALPIHEETDLPFKSQNEGVMHACGHDAHTAMLLGVAQIMNQHKNNFAGSVVCIFQNAEETKPGGAKSMIEDGALEDVDVIYGIHVVPEHEVGNVGYSMSYGSAASDTIEINVQGRGGHASRPHEAIDSVVIASEIITNLQSIVSRFVDPIDPAVLTFSSVAAGGGTAPNIIADQAKIKGTVRTFSEETRQTIKRKFKQMTQAIVEMNDGSVEVNYYDGYPALLNNRELVKNIVDRIQSAQLFNEVLEIGPMNGAAMIGEDFAYYLQKVPGAFLNIGVKNPGESEAYPLHHPKFNLAEEALSKGMELYLFLLMQHLNEVTE